MELVKTKLDGVYIVEPKVYGDNRGWFMETYSEKAFKDAGIDVTFVQDNHSYSAQKGVLRGLHFQLNPMSQAKLLRVLFPGAYLPGGSKDPGKRRRDGGSSGSAGSCHRAVKTIVSRGIDGSGSQEAIQIEGRRSNG